VILLDWCYSNFSPTVLYAFKLKREDVSVLVILSTTLTEAGFPMNNGKWRKSSHFENYSSSIDRGRGVGGSALCTNRYTSINDLEISPGSACKVPEICGICHRTFYILLAYAMRQYIYDSRSCETNVFQRYTSLLYVTGTSSFRDIFSLFIFYKIYQVRGKHFLRETNFFTFA